MTHDGIRKTYVKLRLFAGEIMDAIDLFDQQDTIPPLHKQAMDEMQKAYDGCRDAARLIERQYPEEVKL